MTVSTHTADRHVRPDHGDHVASEGCACGPKRYVLCQQCDWPGVRGCWACGGTGVVAAPAFHPGPFVYLHSD